MDGSSMWGGLNSGVVLSLIAVLWTMAWQNLQHLQLQQFVSRKLGRHARRLAALVDPYLSVTIAEYEGGRMRRSDVFEEVKAYLSASCSRDVRHLRAEGAKDADTLVLSMVDGEELPDEFRGAAVWWWAYSRPPPRADASLSLSYYGGGGQEERRFYRLFFLERDRELVLDAYLPHVRRQGRAVMKRNRQRKLLTNISTHQWSEGGGFARSAWSHVPFEHPKTFATLAMDPARKREIVDDLDAFRDGKDYYARVGRAWKRGYLLYGPPGTGKSAMVAAMANHLGYDVYDIELTSVHSNTDLRRLFIETTSKSIIVIEDIDCSLDLTGARNKPPPATEEQDEERRRKSSKDEKKNKAADAGSKVTLSGLLNFIDGLWSACGGERIIVFTTNHVDRLDPALIRRGRMDRHIEMSYCGFEAFKFLAKMYHDVDAHRLFGSVQELLREVDITPADVAENLTPKGAHDDADSCLAALVKALQEAKDKKKNNKASGGDGKGDHVDEEEEQQ